MVSSAAAAVASVATAIASATDAVYTPGCAVSAYTSVVMVEVGQGGGNSELTVRNGTGVTRRRHNSLIKTESGPHLENRGATLQYEIGVVRQNPEGEFIFCIIVLILSTLLYNK
jgi:hypothetical protein